MADNTDNDALDHPIHPLPGNLQAEIISTTKKAAVAPNQEPENMEVHHAHHPTHKKKWSEYLLEFLMLFLAVFLGFIAENIRENIVERHREKEYIKQIVQNLKDDTAKLHRVIPFLERRVKVLDSIVKMSKEDLTNAENLKLITRQAVTVANFTMFNANTATIAQLKAGNLRLIQRNHAADSILKYDLLNEGTKTQWNVCYSLFTAYIEKFEDVFDITIMMDSSYNNGMIQDKLPPPLNPDKEKLQVYFNRAVAYFITSRDYRVWLINQLSYAEKLTAFLKKVYHLEDE